MGEAEGLRAPRPGSERDPRSRDDRDLAEFRQTPRTVGLGIQVLSGFLPSRLPRSTVDQAGPRPGSLCRDRPRPGGRWPRESRPIPAPRPWPGRLTAGFLASMTAFQARDGRPEMGAAARTADDSCRKRPIWSRGRPAEVL